MRRLLPLIIIVFIAFFSCDRLFDQDLKEDFYPLTDGNIWEYRATKDSDSWIERYVINGTTLHNNGFTVFVEDYYNNGQLIPPPSYLYQNDSGLYIYYYLDSDTYFQYLKFPLQVGDEWEFDYGIDTYSMEYETLEDVDVPAGLFVDCYKVSAKHNREHYLNYWYKPGIGIVKYHWIDDDQYLDLRSYTLN